jgi:hypothetical protein
MQSNIQETRNDFEYKEIKERRKTGKGRKKQK